MVNDPSNILLAFGLTLFSGLATGVGGLFTFFHKRTNTKLLSVVLGFSAGVMIYVSFVEIFFEAKKHLEMGMGQELGQIVTAASFFGGMLLIAIIDKLIPSYENPHKIHRIEEVYGWGKNFGYRKKAKGKNTFDRSASRGYDRGNNRYDRQKIKNRKLLRTGLFTALAITIHNFPEGIVAFTSALTQPSLGIAVSVAIAIHNLPEGIAVSIPVYCATGSRLKALKMSVLSGLSEPLGAVAGYLILMPFLNDIIFGIIFAAVAGIMGFISFDELLPTAREYGEHHLTMYGVIAGMAFMAFSLILVT